MTSTAPLDTLVGMNVTHGKGRKIQVNDNVNLIVREVSITEAGPSPKTIEAVELREYLKNAEVEGHGVYIPKDQVENLIGSLRSVVGIPE